MKRIMMTICSAALLALMLPLAAEAEEPQATVKEKIDVEEVLLDVLVTDKKGNVVLGLDEDDFIVEEDGEPVEIRDVTFYSNRRFLESSEEAREIGIDPQAVPVDRYFVLFFHDQRQVFGRLISQQLDAGRRAKQWVRMDLLPNDYVAVVSYQYSLKLHQDFTNDADAIEQAISDAVRGLTPKTYRANSAGAPSLFRNIPQDELEDVGRFHEAMEVVGKGSGAVPVRTNLILFSAGFGEIDGFGFYRPDPRYYPDMVRALNDNNVAVYTIDLIPTSFSTGFFPSLLSSSLHSLAADTGGEHYATFVSFNTPLEQISQSLNGYYMISYTSEVSGEKASSYREVDVDTVNPNLRVRSREGYLRGS